MSVKVSYLGHTYTGESNPSPPQSVVQGTATKVGTASVVWTPPGMPEKKYSKATVYDVSGTYWVYPDRAFAFSFKPTSVGKTVTQVNSLPMVEKVVVIVGAGVVASLGALVVFKELKEAGYIKLGMSKLGMFKPKSKQNKKQWW